MFRDFMRQRLGLRDSMGSNTMDYQTPNEVPTGFNSNPFHPQMNHMGWPGHPMNGATLPPPNQIAASAQAAQQGGGGTQPNAWMGASATASPQVGQWGQNMVGATLPPPNQIAAPKGFLPEGGPGNNGNGRVGGMRDFNPFAW